MRPPGNQGSESLFIEEFTTILFLKFNKIEKTFIEKIGHIFNGTVYWSILVWISSISTFILKINQESFISCCFSSQMQGW